MYVYRIRNNKNLLSICRNSIFLFKMTESSYIGEANILSICLNYASEIIV